MKAHQIDRSGSGGRIGATVLRRCLPALAWIAIGTVDARGQAIRGLTGEVDGFAVAVPAADAIRTLSETPRPADVDLQKMAGWAMNYLIRTPRPGLGYEPVFQCHPLRCPPAPEADDPVVACDTDARMDWEWYYMREVSGSTAGRGVEAAFPRRIRSYIAPDGKVWSHPRAFNEGNTRAKYGEKDRVIHIWGATKILQSLSEHHRLHKDAESKELARKVMLALKGRPATRRASPSPGLMPTAWSPAASPAACASKPTAGSTATATRRCTPSGVSPSWASRPARPNTSAWPKGAWDFMLARGTGTG